MGRYRDHPHLNGLDPVDWEVVLRPDGSFSIYCCDCVTQGDTHTIGYQNRDKNAGETLFHGTTSVIQTVFHVTPEPNARTITFTASPSGISETALAFMTNATVPTEAGPECVTCGGT